MNNNIWELPQELMTIIFNTLDSKSGAQIKLMSLLIGLPGDGSVRLTEKLAMETCGISECGYKKARKALVERGWLIHDKANKQLIVDFDAIYDSAK